MSSSAAVLVFDPDPTSRILVTAVVQRSGLRPVACDSEEEAARRCVQSEPYAAVILSADLPHCDVLLRRLRMAPRSRSPRVILTTTDALATPDALQVDAVLRKPLEVAGLEEAIAACCAAAGAELLA
jgi:CheY-like chemotaxis protein